MSSAATNSHTHQLHIEMSRCCRCLRSATDLKLASVNLGQLETYILWRPGELLYRTFMLTSVIWLLPVAHKTGIEILFFLVFMTPLSDLTLYAKSFQFGHFSNSSECNVGKMWSIQQRNSRQTATSGNQSLLKK